MTFKQKFGLDYFSKMKRLDGLIAEVKTWHKAQKPAPSDLLEGQHQAWIEAGDALGRLVMTGCVLYILLFVLWLGSALLASKLTN